MAIRLTKTELRPGTADNDVNAILSTAGGLPEGYMVMDFLTSPFAWFLLTNIAGTGVHERIPFETDMQVDFVTDNLLVKSYERYSFGYFNWRSVYVNTPKRHKDYMKNVSDINGGFSPNANGSPIFPGTLFTGPVLAGNVVHSDGSGTLAAVGETNVGTANVGYCVMAQSAIITQVTPSQTTTIVIPAQSQILAIYLMVTVAWSTGTTTLGIGTTALATAFTTSTGVQGSTWGKSSSPRVRVSRIRS